MKKKDQILAGNVARKCFPKCDIKASSKPLITESYSQGDGITHEWFIFSSLYFFVFSKVDNKYELLCDQKQKITDLTVEKRKIQRSLSVISTAI